MKVTMNILDSISKSRNVKDSTAEGSAPRKGKALVTKEYDLANIRQTVEAPALVSFPRAQWERFTPQEQKEHLQHFSVHVVGRSNAPVIPDVQSMEDAKEHLKMTIEMDKPLFCHGKNFKGFLTQNITRTSVDLQAEIVDMDSGVNDRFRQSNLYEFIEMAEKNEAFLKDNKFDKLRILNFLDISLDGAMLRPPVSVAYVAYMVAAG